MNKCKIDINHGNGLLLLLVLFTTTTVIITPINSYAAFDFIDCAKIPRHMTSF